MQGNNFRRATTIFSNPKWSLYLSFTLIVLTSLLLLLFYQTQTKKFQPNSIIENIKSHGTFLPLSIWEAELFNCQNECNLISESLTNIELPSKTPLVELKSRVNGKSNAVKLTHRVTLQNMEAIRESGRKFVNLVIPRSVHAGIEGQVGDLRFPLILGNQLNIVWTIPTAEIKKSAAITLFYRLNYEWQEFGPLSFPVALIDAGQSHLYAQISHSQGLLQFLGNDWFVYVAFSVAILTLVLDFSTSLFILATFLAAISLRTYLYSFSSVKDLEIGVGFALCNAVVFSLLVAYCLSLYQPVKKFAKPILFSGVFMLVALLLLLRSDRFFMISDLVTDIAGSAIGILIVGYGTIRLRSTRESKFFVSMAVAVIALAMLLISNAVDLNSVFAGSEKNPLQVGHFIFVPLLFLSSLVDLGSMKKIFSDLKVAAIREKEIEESKAFQKANLPPNLSYKAQRFSWDIVYQPVNPLSGDWFDIEEVHLGSRALVLGCVIDVTGHGLIAAQHLSAVMVAWNQCKRDLKESRRGISKQQTEFFLCNSASAINDALMAIPASLGASSILFVLDTSESMMSFLSNGHPGIILKNGAISDYLTLANNRHGIEQFFDLKVSHVEVKSGSKIFVFSDGFYEPRSNPLKIDERFELIRGHGINSLNITDDLTAIRLEILS